MTVPHPAPTRPCTREPTPPAVSSRRPVSSRRRGAVLLAGAAVLAVAGCTTDNDPPESTTDVPSVFTGSPAPLTTGETPGEPGHSPGGNFVTAGFADPEGDPAGTVTFVERAGFLEIQARVSGLEPGFHGFHVHENGTCEADSTAPDGDQSGDFLSAGGHLQLGDRTGFPASGDLTSLYVRDDGRGLLVTSTDAFTLADLNNNGRGRAVVVHAGPDNFGNIPTRYTLPDGAAVPDRQTLTTGDAGPRVACAVVE
ncbi:superoxide dismutase family protein [Rhodococcus sp. DMU1]|uniref:superoxide dismutase[Cu-Zn] n=1 Tax=Rhodococcus sp. DMU1 TaxID=2722825 RepID=UPI001FF07D63|nr:superoxide dismutase family protein [Rhodococcus sp. DMU1]